MKIFSGTISHVAPEQLRGEKPHPAMDIYSLGIMLFELVTGQHPFADLTALDMIYHHNHVMPPDAAGQSVSIEEVVAVVGQCQSWNACPFC